MRLQSLEFSKLPTNPLPPMAFHNVCVYQPPADEAGLLADLSLSLTQLLKPKTRIRR